MLNALATRHGDMYASFELFTRTCSVRCDNLSLLPGRSGAGNGSSISNSVRRLPSIHSSWRAYDVFDISALSALPQRSEKHQPHRTDRTRLTAKEAAQSKPTKAAKLAKNIRRVRVDNAKSVISIAKRRNRSLG